MHLPCCSGPHEITDCREGVLDTDDFRLPAIRTYLGLGFMADVVEADHSNRWPAIFARLNAPATGRLGR